MYNVASQKCDILVYIQISGSEYLNGPWHLLSAQGLDEYKSYISIQWMKERLKVRF